MESIGILFSDVSVRYRFRLKNNRLPIFRFWWEIVQNRLCNRSCFGPLSILLSNASDRKVAVSGGRQYGNSRWFTEKACSLCTSSLAIGLMTSLIFFLLRIFLISYLIGLPQLSVLTGRGANDAVSAFLFFYLFLITK